MAGVFGKLPLRGDFLSRELPREFIDGIDKWFREGLRESQRMLGDGWFPHYQVMPVWRFYLGPALLSNQAWLGVWIPSEDRVNRRYPLLAASPVANTLVASFRDLAVYEDWLDEVADTLVQALMEAEDVEVVCESLKRLEPHAERATSDCKSCSMFDMPEQWLGANLLGNQQSHCVQKQNVSGALIEPDYCVWQSDGNDEIDRQLVVTRGLPRADQFINFLGGFCS